MKNKTIAIFTGYYFPHMGGVERYTEKLAAELVRKKNKVIIVTSNYDNLNEHENIKGVEVLRVPIHRIFKNRFPLIRHNDKYKEIVKELDEFKIDYIICNTRFYSTSKFAYKFGNKRSIPVVCIEHGSNYMSIHNPVLDFFGHIYEHFITFKMKKNIDAFYGVSERCIRWLKTFNINGRGVIYNSIDDDAFEKYKNSKYIEKKNNEIILLYSGRIIKEKCVNLLLDAFLDLEKKYENIKLYIAGQGDCLEQYKELYNNSKIIFTGNLPYEELMKLYNQADIFVHPSDYPEGLPTVLLEAGLMRCALVATDRGGTKEVIGNDENGIIIEPTKNDIKEKIKYLLDNKNELKKYQDNSHKIVSKKFTWSKTADYLCSELLKLDNMRIYIASHKNVTFPNQNIYKPIRVGSALTDCDFGFIRDDSGLNISDKNKNYCELTATYWIMNNNNNYNITGLVHYRRYFIKWFKKKKIDNAINRKYINKILKKYDIIVPNRTFIIKHNNEKSWEYDHHKIDYDLVRNIINDLYPDYSSAFEKFSKKKTLHICNMFIANKDIFNAYYKWLFDILFELEKRTDISNYDDYNKRLFGFMSERLFNVWLIKNNHLKIKKVPVYNINKRMKNQFFMIN